MDPFLVDTHTHLYLPEFDNDRDEVIRRSLDQNVRLMMLPNIDHASIDPMNDLVSRFPDCCFPMMGLHPTSVREDFKDELDRIKTELQKGKYYGIGETGIDLHWERKYLNKQCQAFEEQVKLALQYHLPLVVHARKSFHEILEILENFRNTPLTGVFHAFTGDRILAEKVIGMGFKLGIGGIVTFKKSGLDEVVRNVGLDHFLLETDSPYLAPVPMRGKRNESSYVRFVAEALALISNISFEEVASITTRNALTVFNKIKNDKY